MTQRRLESLRLKRKRDVKHALGWGGGGPPPVGDNILLEDGTSNILLEDGSSGLMLEA
jgi:hypothetical protein